MAGKGLILPEEMRAELREPLGTLLEGDPRDTLAQLKSMLRSKGSVMFASVGDFVSRNVIEAGLEPDIVVVDYRIMRVNVEPLELGRRVKILARNPRGTISSDAWRALEEAVMLKSSVSVIVEGEEDLLVLPLIVLMPVGSMIAYGQPHRGIVVVEVNGERKRWAEGIMRRMEES